jgi:hypothetical protein
VYQQQQALRLIGRSLVGLAVSCALVLQLLLAGLALGGAASAASSSDPFVICYGDGGGDVGHDPDRKSNHPLHCLLACAQALGSLAPPLPPSEPLLHAPQASSAPSQFRAAAVSIPSRLGAAHPSRGPPEA